MLLLLLLLLLLNAISAGSFQGQAMPLLFQADPAAPQQHCKLAAILQGQVPTTTQQQRQHCRAARLTALGLSWLLLLVLLLVLTRRALPAMLCLKKRVGRHIRSEAG
jgi:hypothetical protein